MADLADTVNEAVEKADVSRLHSHIAILVAGAATFMALCNVKDGNIVQAMAQDQAKAVDAWAYYQAKGMKLNLAESMMDQLTLQRTLAPVAGEVRAILDQKIASYAEQVKKYEREKEEIKATAEGFEKEYDRLNLHDDQFDMAEALISISLALFGITALTRKKTVFWLAGVFSGIGALLGLAGFLGFNIHPDFLARLLG
jgi:hypothetical protein